MDQRALNSDSDAHDSDDESNETELQDDEVVAYSDENPSGDEIDDDDESEMSSIPDDNSSDSDVSPSILDGLSDGEDLSEMSFQELQQRLKRAKELSRGRLIRIRKLESSLNRSCQKETDLQQQNQTLLAKIESLRKRLDGVRDPPVPWQDILARGAPRDLVWREFAQQNNMSAHQENRHPELNWGLPDNGEPDDPGYESADPDVPANNGEPDDPGYESADPDVPANNGEPDDPGYESDIEVEPDARNFDFNFDMLPLVVQERIFRYLLVKTELIHCISRFDPGGNDGTVFHRFHVGPSSCTIRRAHRPASILKYLLVSKRWLFMGVNCFFSQNTFAFSSLGEFGSFMAWLPRARRERMQHIEIFWQGSIMPRHETRINQRTLPLTYLCKTLRLKTLVVHIQEMDKRTRRRYERLDCDELDDLVSNKIFDVDEIDHKHRDAYKLDPSSINPYKLMKRTTGAQPNFRASRSMRTCHGMDYVYQLRGMSWIRFKESNRKDRQNIRDWSFVEDLNSVVTMPKAARDASRSELENIYPISCLRDFVAADADWEIIYRWYGQLPQGSILGDTQGAPSIPPTETVASTIIDLVSDDDSDDSNDDSERDSSSSSDGGDDEDGGNDGDDSEGTNGGENIDCNSAVADLDNDCKMESEGSPGHSGDIGAILNFIDLTLDPDDDEPDPEPADRHSPQSHSPPSENAFDTRSRSESLFVRSDDGSDKGSRSESLFVRSNSTSSAGAKTDGSGDSAKPKHFVIDLTTIDEETEPSSQDAAGASKQGVMPGKDERQP